VVRKLVPENQEIPAAWIKVSEPYKFHVCVAL